MNTVGDPISADEAFEYGLANRVVEDHELFDAALAWARKLAGQAPLAVEEIKRLSAPRRPRRGPGGRARRVPARARLRGRARGRRGVHREARAEVPGQSERRSGLAELLRTAGPAVVLTGAGVSVPSGIPDFRTPMTGLWANVDPMEVAHIDVWRRDPERFWDFYGQRFAILDGKQPNGAHRAIAELERRGLVSGVVTQNIDGLHALAGSDPIEVHGSIRTASCLACGASYSLADTRARFPLPRCDCGAVAEAGCRAVRRAAARARDAARDGAGDEHAACCSRSAPRWRSGRSRACPRTRCARAASWRS